MAQAASYHAGGRSKHDYTPRYVSGVSYNPPSNIGATNNRGGTQKQKLTLSTSLKSLGNEFRAGGTPTTSSPKSYQRNALRSAARGVDTNMTSYSSSSTTTTAVTAPPPPRSDSKHAKLHKRGGSGSSLTLPPSPYSGSHSQFTTPFATYEEPFPEISSSSTTTPTSSTPKIKPYLRKMSSAKEDQNQGRLDLSKSTSENGVASSGLGIQESSSRSASDVTFTHTTGRRTTPHMRTTSGGSQVSTASGSFRPNLPFVHPMRQTPRPYTPPTGGQSYASSLNSDEAQESDDIVTTDDEFRLGHGFRTRRSMSIPGTPQIQNQPTPLSQTHTASDVDGSITTTTITQKYPNTSQTNLSLKSSRSVKSSKSHQLGGRSRRNTERRSADFGAAAPTSPSTRTSFDKAFPFVSRRSDTDPASRDERIAVARRRFEQKEADKDRKLEEEARRRRELEVRKDERQRRKSEAEERAKISKQYSRDDGEGGGTKKGRSEEFTSSRSYDAYRPSHSSRTDWGAGGGGLEKVMRGREEHTRSLPSAWKRFSTWLQTRLLSCGGKGA